MYSHHDYEEAWAPKATMADAHREWHSNAGVPMGQPGCPQDACHPPDDEYDEPEPVTDEMYQSWREANEYLYDPPEHYDELPDDGMPF